MSSHPTNLLRVSLTLSFSLALTTPLLIALTVSPAQSASKYSLAKNLLNKKQYKEALVESERLLKSDPNDEKAHLLHVDALHSLQRIKQANQELNKVIEHNPKSSAAYSKRAKTYLAVNQPLLAKQDIERALTLNPKNAEAYNDLGLLLYHFKKDRERAVEAFGKAVEIDPKYAQALRHRGILRFQLSQFDLAKQDLDKAIKLEPDYSDSFNTRGRVYHALGQYDKAIADFERAIQLNPKYDSPYTNMGLALVKLGRVKEAIGWYSKAVELQPHAQNYCNRGTAYIRLKKFAAGEEDLKQALKLDPKFPNTHNSLGALYQMTGRKKEARKEFEIAIALDPNEIGLRRNRGILLANEGKLEEAMLDLQQTQSGQRSGRELSVSTFQATVKDCTKMIRLHPDNHEFFYDRGFAYFCLGDWPSALADFEMFRTVSATSSKTAMNAAILSNFAYRRQGLKKEAGVPIKQVLERTKIPERKYWAYRFVEYLSGDMAALSFALNDDSLGVMSKTALKCYFGIDRAIAGDIATAKTQLNWIKDYGDRETDEFELAMTELARLNKPTKVKSRSEKAKSRTD